MKIVHICSLDKFIPPFIKHVDENFDSKQHVYWILGERKDKELDTYNNINFLGKSKVSKAKNIFHLIKDIHYCDKIILHSFLGLQLALLFFFTPWVLKKCYWFIWGGDLYSYKGRRNLKWYVREFFRRPVIKRFGYLVTYIKGDYELAKIWYGCLGNYLECLMYTSNIYNELHLDDRNDDYITILLGNSADPSNNHISAFDRIAKFKNSKIKIISPLSYGKKEYAEEVIEKGVAIFGDSFIPITDFMPREQYFDILSKVDIAVFNHDRQQAMGNTISLLGLKKTVFINKKTTQWELFEDKNIKVFDVDDFSIKFISEEEKENNHVNIKNNFSYEQLTNQLRIVFGCEFAS
ncbi:hypothetical protein FUU19_07050 [Serratia sp. Lou2A]|uniref:4-alpha-L-fucosyltransferase n=1 Tax=Serratia montpellierensis TaxID=2598730 RepID=A0ABS8J617_9GAMM|nr:MULTISPECIES: TDP-N-acetylfucosamine:lipid II N-acetylfucosaminyltransferase [unclassified Serratia (in: enterobacteria)]MCC7583281.1 hypothetical protein [Serratia sp. Lou2A]MCC7659453.1 hypothetical protein [Serratia sp. Pon4B]